MSYALALAPPPSQPQSIPTSSASGLSPRQEQVLSLAAHGLPLKLMACELAISISTVSSHLGAALARLGIRRCELGRLGRHGHVGGARPQAALETGAFHLPPELTPAERAVVQALLQGLSNSQIARHRNRSDRTVANQIACAFKKLGVGSRAELYARAGE
jgi:DNA-binding NarL/FixJ family response regulator